MLTEPDARFDLSAYLAHIGFSGVPAPDVATLREICRLHPLAIPFENLTVLAGQPVTLDIDALQAKMIGTRRGGYCYEHNHVLAHALEAIGFDVAGLAARVLWGQSEDAITAQSHMALRVRIQGQDWLADAGFGGMTLTGPLLLQPDIVQETPHERFRLRPIQADMLLEAEIGGEWRLAFRFGLEPRFRPDYELANYWVSTHPQSPFVSSLIVSRAFEGGRRTLFNTRLSEYRAGAAPVQRELDVEETEDALEALFGLDVPDRAALRRALEAARSAAAA